MIAMSRAEPNDARAILDLVDIDLIALNSE